MYVRAFSYQVIYVKISNIYMTMIYIENKETEFILQTLFCVCSVCLVLTVIKIEYISIMICFFKESSFI